MVALSLLSLTVGTVLFVVLDGFYSAAVLSRSAKHLPTGAGLSTLGLHGCRVPDPVRHHALRPNCSSIELWGRDSYEVNTNNMGFRDESVRQVPLTDKHPRLLMLGDSFTEGKSSWSNSYVGQVSAHLPEYDFLNGGIESYSPSNYLNVARMVLSAGVEFDEAVVFIDISDVQDEAAYYRDLDASGAVAGPKQEHFITPWYSTLRLRISRHLFVTSHLIEFFERKLVRSGYFHLAVGQGGNIFDLNRSAWTYRKVPETDTFDAGYAPLGVDGGIGKERAKMTLLWEELAKWHIPISIVVYPWPAQVVHDTADSRQVQVWREWCEGRCKRFISLFPAFLSVKNACSPEHPGCWYLSHFIFGDFHYNAAGNALVARAVIESLRAMPPTKASSYGLRIAKSVSSRRVSLDDTSHF